MPLVHDGERIPEWSELREYRIIRGAAGVQHRLASAGRQKIIVASGLVRVIDEAGEPLAARGKVELPRASAPILEFIEAGTAVWMAGTWSDPTGGSGVFRMERSADPHDVGDPVSYAKETTFDAHFHDCDEFWVIVEGRGVAVSEGRHYEIAPGDCVATRMGDHHDLPIAREPVVGVYIETTLGNLKRRGHLWDHTHGPALPSGRSG